MMSRPGIICSRANISSIWTNFKDVFNGETLVDTYSVGDTLATEWPATETVPNLSRAVASVAGSISGQAYHLQATGAGSATSKTLEFGQVASALDCDVLMGFRIASGANGRLGPACRIRDDGAGVIAAYRASNHEALFAPRVHLIQPPNAAAGANGADTLTTGTWYWGRLNTVGNETKAKYWARGSPEPASWTTTSSSAGNAITAGRVGIWNLMGTNLNADVDFFSVSTDGLPAYGADL